MEIRPSHVAAAGASLLIILAAFMPWATIGILSISGIDNNGDGTFTVLLGFIALGVVAFGTFARKWWWAALATLLGGIVIAIGFYDVLRIVNLNDETQAVLEVSVGAGLLLTVIGGGLLALTGLWVLLEEER